MGVLRLEKVGLCEARLQGTLVHRGTPRRKPGPEKSSAGRGGGGQGLQLPCLLGIRYLLTHLGPLARPKYTPAKNVTMETVLGSGRLPESKPTGKVQLCRGCSHRGSDLVRVKGKGALSHQGKPGPEGSHANLSAHVPGGARAAENSTNRSSAAWPWPENWHLELEGVVS